MRTRLIIPRGDRTFFALPDLATASNVARGNRELLERNPLDIQGRSLAELRNSARREILQLANSYTADLTGEPVNESLTEELLFCSGHQPSLFHPGVWIKNFAIRSLADQTGGLALNLVIDNDTVSNRQIRVPIGPREEPSIRDFAFDDPHSAVPWEEAAIENLERFEQFGPQVSGVMADWQIEPILREIWPDAVSQSRKSPLLRDALTAARIKLERRWGLSNLEVPLSRVCETEVFLWFAAAILTRLPKFWAAYNSVLGEFRSVNRIRSQTHPVPQLAEDDGWYEAPFWVWPEGGSRRQRVFAKACSREVRLSDGREIFARLPLTSGSDVADAVAVLKELPGRGIRFRTRALTTTLFSRLCLADLFVHGIGGAKYDEMTDRLIARFFGLKAPGFLTLSCTVHLPLGKPYSVHPEEERKILHELRDVKFNPERHLTGAESPEIETSIAEKKALMAEKVARETSGLSLADRRRRHRENHERHLRLKEITEQLRGETAKARRLLEAELETVRQQLRANAVLEDREFSFALYPEEKLRPFLKNAVKPAV